MASFPETTRGFAEYFVTLQELHHEADYDPEMSFTRQEVLKAIEVAETMIEKLMASEDQGQTSLSGLDRHE